MDGNGITLKSLLQYNALEVPFFQRPYVWETEHFEALIDSLEDSPEATMPFFGSVILKEFGGKDNLSGFDGISFDLYNSSPSLFSWTE